MKKFILSILMLCVLLSSCGDKKATPDTANKPNLTQKPDISNVGKIERITVKAKGMGNTLGAATNDALKNAVMQANGVKIASASAQLEFSQQMTAKLDLETSEGNFNAKGVSELKGERFAEAVISKSNGLISSFKVLDIKQIDTGYMVEIETQISKFKAPEDTGKVKIVVAPLRSETATFDIGGRQIPAEQILEPIRQQIIDFLAQTGRFTILDRQFGSEIESELDMIRSGQTANTDFAKLGQAFSADVVWVGAVNTLGYNRHSRRLQTTTRELVSYSGGWSVSQRLINLTTRQIMQSNTLQGTLPSISPTTLATGYDEHAIIKNIENEIAKKATEAIILQTFPISIVEKDGYNVVLSQGGQVVREKNRYMVYLQGKEIKDPQTGQSLGNMEQPCCEVVVHRVTPKLSYGILENVTMDLTNVQSGALLVKEVIDTVKLEVPKQTSADGVVTEERQTTVRKSVKRVPRVRSRVADDDW